jgi:hypothetical protein
VPWKPLYGERPNDFISEGQSELHLMRATYDVGNIRWIPDRDDHRTQSQFLAQRYAAGNHTRVTFHEDFVGAQHVWQLVKPRLLEMGFLNE